MKLVETTQDIAKGNIGDVHLSTIKTSSKAFRVLSSTLYSNKPKAIVRELSTNARDAQVMVQKGDIPFEVTLPSLLDLTFSIRDFGPGLAEEQIYTLFITYFESTKTESNDFNGQLGLGCKSPYSYASTFTVISRQNGVKKTYACFMNEAFIPSVTKLLTEETTEADGLEISLQVLEQDINSFHQAAREVYRFFDIKPIIKNYDNFKFDAPLEPLIYCNDTSVVHRRDSKYPINSVTMGYVNYPIDYQVVTQTLRDHIAKLYNDEYANRLLNAIQKMNRSDFGIHISAPIGTVDFAPSREALSYDKQTCMFIFEQTDLLFKDVLEKLDNSVDVTMKPWQLTEFAATADKQLAKKYWPKYSTETVSFPIRSIITSMRDYAVSINGFNINLGFGNLHMSTEKNIYNIDNLEDVAVTSVTPYRTRSWSPVSRVVSNRNSYSLYHPTQSRHGSINFDTTSTVFIIDNVSDVKLREKVRTFATRLKLLFLEGLNPTTTDNEYVEYKTVYVLHNVKQNPSSTKHDGTFFVGKNMGTILGTDSTIPVEPVDVEAAISYVEAIGAKYILMSEIQTRSIQQLTRTRSHSAASSALAQSGKSYVTIGASGNIYKSLASDMPWDEGGFYFPTTVISTINVNGSGSSLYHEAVVNSLTKNKVIPTNAIIYAIPESQTKRLNDKWVNVYDLAFEYERKALHKLHSDMKKFDKDSRFIATRQLKPDLVYDYQSHTHFDTISAGCVYQYMHSYWPTHSKRIVKDVHPSVTAILDEFYNNIVRAEKYSKIRINHLITLSACMLDNPYSEEPEIARIRSMITADEMEMMKEIQEFNDRLSNSISLNSLTDAEIAQLNSKVAKLDTNFDAFVAVVSMAIIEQPRMFDQRSSKYADNVLAVLNKTLASIPPLTLK